jgi:hypothetical protein
VDRLARDLQAEFPGVEGVSPRNLHYVRSLAEAWPDELILQQVAFLRRPSRTGQSPMAASVRPAAVRGTATARFLSIIYCRPGVSLDRNLITILPPLPCPHPSPAHGGDHPAGGQLRKGVAAPDPVLTGEVERELLDPIRMLLPPEFDELVLVSLAEDGQAGRGPAD